MLEFTKVEKGRLKNFGFDEKWLQDRIEQDTAILGLGELELVDRERSQKNGGRLDFLLKDDEEDRRYEIEIMLGATDANHVVRCIEYWDEERKRFPSHEHCAVLIAEDITSRFLNILQLFNGQIPLIAIQLSVLKLGDKIALDFVKVLDQASSRADDEEDPVRAPANREYWSSRRPPQVMKKVDELFDLFRELAPEYRLNYMRGHIGLTNGTRANNFVVFYPKKQFLKVSIKVENHEKWVEDLSSAGLTVEPKRRRDGVTLRLPAAMEMSAKQKERLTAVLSTAVHDQNATEFE